MNAQNLSDSIDVQPNDSCKKGPFNYYYFENDLQKWPYELFARGDVR